MTKRDWRGIEIVLIPDGHLRPRIARPAADAYIHISLGTPYGRETDYIRMYPY